MKVVIKICKIAFKTILIILGVSILICLCIIPFDNKIRKEIMKMPINNVDLNKIENGKYLGHFKKQLRSYNVEVTVNNHRIINIKAVENSVTNNYSKKIFDRVIDKQKIGVDTISGATVTSKIILKSIENALN